MEEKKKSKIRVMIDCKGNPHILIDKEHPREDIERILVEEYGYAPEQLTYEPGVMGVPITYMDKHDPEQFDILDMLRPVIDGKAKYARFLIRRKPESFGSGE